MHYASKDCFLLVILVILILICGFGGVGQGKAIHGGDTNISSHMVAGGEINGTVKVRSSSPPVSSNGTILGSSRTPGFIKYNDTNNGYSIQYPSDWSASSVQTSRLLLGSPDHVAQVDILILDSVPNGTSLEDAAKTVVRADSAYPLEINTNTYFLSRHPAARIIELATLPLDTLSSHPEARIIEPGKPYKGMTWLTIIDNKAYIIAYAASPPERFTDYLHAAQMITNSFQITNKR